MIRTAVILAGGAGTRLRPVTLEIPKPLIPVQGKPILTWQVEWFLGAGVEDIVITVPPRWFKKFEEWRIENREWRFGIDLWVEPKPMGTLGALVHHLNDRVGGGPFFVTNGDELKNFDLAALEAFHRDQKPLATIALVRVPNPSDYGVAEMDGHRIVQFHEKPEIPPSTLVSSGLYVIEPKALRVPDWRDQFLMFEKDLFPQIAREGELAGCPLEGPWFDCGTMERWEKAINEWRSPLS